MIYCERPRYRFYIYVQTFSGKSVFSFHGHLLFESMDELTKMFNCRLFVKDVGPRLHVKPDCT